MQRVINFLRGSVRVTAHGAFPERFLNLCGQERLAFWQVQWLDAYTIRLRAARAGAGRLNDLARRAQCELTLDERRGMPDFLLRFRRRYALLLGLLCALATVIFCSNFVLVVDVSGNEAVPTRVILSELKRQGVGPGAWGPGIDERVASNAVLLALDGLSFCSVNLHGIRAEVVVREKELKPALEDESAPSDVFAETAGIITHIENLRGELRVKEGDTVVQGDLLICGTITVKGPEYGPGDLGSYEVHACGRVWARTWRTLRAQIPLTAQVKSRIKSDQARYCVNLLGHRINFYRKAGNYGAGCGKISETKTARLPGGAELPLSWTKETLFTYETASAQLDPDAAQTLLRQTLQARLDALIGQEEEVLRCDWVAVRRDGMLTLTLLAECREQIAVVVQRN